MLANLSNSRYNKNVGSGNTLGVSGMCYFYFLKEVLPLEKLFKLKENGTSVRTEIVAGVTTFMTMAYIIALNPNLLTNFDVGSALWNGVFLATCMLRPSRCSRWLSSRTNLSVSLPAWV